MSIGREAVTTFVGGTALVERANRRSRRVAFDWEDGFELPDMGSLTRDLRRRSALDQQTARCCTGPHKSTGRGVHTSTPAPHLLERGRRRARLLAQLAVLAAAGGRQHTYSTGTVPVDARRSCLLSPGSADGGQCEVMGPLHAGGRDIICVTPASRFFRHGSVT